MSHVRTSLHPDGLPAELAAALSDFTSVFDRLRGVEVDRNRLRHVEQVTVGGVTLFLKRFHGVQWKNLWRLRTTEPRARSQGEREFRMARELEAAGLRPGRPLAFGDETTGPLGRELRSFFASEGLPGASYASLLSRGAPRVQREDMRRRAAAALSSAFARGIVIPDLSVEHLFRLPSGEPGIIDLHNGWIGAPAVRDIARALSRLERSLTRIDPAAALVPFLERLRFAAAFARGIPQAPRPRELLARVRTRSRSGYLDPSRVRRYTERSQARARREADLLRTVLAPLGLTGVALDVPAGSGRMTPLLRAAGATRVLLADASSEMLKAATHRDATQRIAARADRLPLGDSSVELTLCMRFLHHLDPRAAGSVLAELARVSRRFLVVSYFHPVSLHGLSRRLRSLVSGRRRGRWSVTARALERSLRPHGFGLRIAVAETPVFHELWVAVFERQP